MDAAKIWSLNYRLLMSVLGSVASELAALGLEPKELFLLSEVDANPHPAALASALCMPKPTVTVYLKRLESAGFVRRDIDPADLRRHRLTLTPMGRLVMQSGQDLLEWQANPHWVRVTLHKTGGPVPNYLTLRGNGREVEIGAFLAEEERLTLQHELRRALSRRG